MLLLVGFCIMIALNGMVWMVFNKNKKNNSYQTIYFIIFIHTFMLLLVERDFCLRTPNTRTPSQCTKLFCTLLLLFCFPTALICYSCCIHLQIFRRYLVWLSPQFTTDDIRARSKCLDRSLSLTHSLLW